MTTPEESPDRPARDRVVFGVALRGTSGRLALGIILLAVGVLLTLDNMGIVNAGHILRFWPAIFIYFGVTHLAKSPRRLVSGVLFTFFGVVLLLDQLEILNFRPGDIIPLVLVFLGLAVIVRTVKGRENLGGYGAGSLRESTREKIREEVRKAREQVVNAQDQVANAFDRAVPESLRGGTAPNAPPGGAPAGSVDRENTIHAFALMAGVTRRSGAAEFRGGEATAIIGGVEIDLRNARPAGNVAVLDVTALWGGIDIQIPTDWAVSGDVTPILGAFQDNSHPPAGTPRTTLLVRGTVIMGGVEVKN